MPSNRVLLAHGDPAVQEAAARVLSLAGATLDIAADPADALLYVARETYGVILTERDDALLAAVAAADGGPRPVVIVTTSNQQSDGLDPQLVSMVVPVPYDATTLVGVVLACVMPDAAPSESADGPALEATC